MAVPWGGQHCVTFSPRGSKIGYYNGHTSHLSCHLDLLSKYFYHFKSNGPAEWLKQELEASLRCVVTQNPSTWEQHLPWIEYAYVCPPPWGKCNKYMLKHHKQFSSERSLELKIWYQHERMAWKYSQYLIIPNFLEEWYTITIKKTGKNSGNHKLKGTHLASACANSHSEGAVKLKRTDGRQTLNSVGKHMFYLLSQNTKTTADI